MFSGLYRHIHIFICTCMCRGCLYSSSFQNNYKVIFRVFSFFKYCFFFSRTGIMTMLPLPPPPLAPAVANPPIINMVLEKVLAAPVYVKPMPSLISTSTTLCVAII